MTLAGENLTFLDKVSIRTFFKKGTVSFRFQHLLDRVVRVLDQEVLDLPPDDIPKLRGKFLYLFPQPYVHRRTFIKNVIEIVYGVTLVRGMVRWLSAGMLVLIDPKFQAAYAMTRLELIRLLLRRIRPVLRLMSSHMALVSEDDPIVEEAVRIDSKNYIDQQTVIKWPPNNVLQLIPDFNSRSAVKFFRTSGVRKRKGVTLVEDLITWNSYYFTRLILEFHLLEKALPYLTIVAPHLLTELSELTVVSVVRYSDRNLTFDEREAYSNLSGSFDTLENAEIWHQRFIVADSKLQVIDCTTDPSLDFVAGQWQFIFRGVRSADQCLIKSPLQKFVTLDVGIFLAGRADENWYHFLLDTLPRLLFFESLSDEIPLLIRDDIPKSAKQLLSRLSSRKVIEMKGDTTYCVERLHFVSARSTVFDSRPIDDLPAIAYSPEIIARLKALVWHAYGEPQSGKKIDLQIAILRDSAYRNVTNIQKVKRVSELAGFRIFDASEVFYKSQIHLFSNASKVIAPGGAVLANMIFMQSASSVIALRSWRTTNLPLWRDLAVACSINYLEVVGRPTYFGWRKMQRQHSDYSISPRKLRRILS